MNFDYKYKKNCVYFLDTGLTGPNIRYIKNILIQFFPHSNSIKIYFLENEKFFVFNFFSNLLTTLEEWIKVSLNEEQIDIILKLIKTEKTKKLNEKNNFVYITEFYPLEETIQKLENQFKTIILKKNLLKENNILELVLEEKYYLYLEGLMIIYAETKEDYYINEQDEWLYWSENK